MHIDWDSLCDACSDRQAKLLLLLKWRRSFPGAQRNLDSMS